MTTLTLSHSGPQKGLALVEEQGRVCGTLTIDRRLRNGEATTDTGTFPLQSWGRRRSQIRLGAEQDPVVRIDGSDVLLSGPSGAQWQISRNRREFRGVLTAPGREIQVTIPANGPVAGMVEISGEWPEQSLLSLTACFALLARRRADNFMTAVAVGAATGGPH